MPLKSEKSVCCQRPRTNWIGPKPVNNFWSFISIPICPARLVSKCDEKWLTQWLGQSAQAVGFVVRLSLGGIVCTCLSVSWSKLVTVAFLSFDCIFQAHVNANVFCFSCSVSLSNDSLSFSRWQMSRYHRRACTATRHNYYSARIQGRLYSALNHLLHSDGFKVLFRSNCVNTAWKHTFVKHASFWSHCQFHACPAYTNG